MGKESRSHGALGAEIERAVTTQEQESKVAGIDYSGSLPAIHENGSGSPSPKLLNSIDFLLVSNQSLIFEKAPNFTNSGRLSAITSRA